VRKNRSNRILWIICVVFVCGILIASVVIGNRLGKSIRSMRPAGVRIQDTICGYVLDNREKILSEFEMMESWEKNYVGIYEMEGNLYGVWNNPLHPCTEIADPAVVNFVSGENVTDLSYPAGSVTDIEINFEKDGVISVKACGFGNVTYAACHGYYYSPEDIPLWVCAEVPRNWSDRTGEYLHHPLVRDGDMWTVDIEAIEASSKESFIDDYCTLRICENLYYYCYGW